MEDISGRSFMNREELITALTRRGREHKAA
ncbi:hypothetical protein FHS38_006498 [Streptomyces netropsis]|uniref:Uncharacterized protein n=1 Tax=Streptomyces netropsis TaxID=55404 RepID=A0A7W7LIN5_STRNE|nr:hypothetical protein [Streptomyces netropsis]